MLFFGATFLSKAKQLLTTTAAAAAAAATAVQEFRSELSMNGVTFS